MSGGHLHDVTGSLHPSLAQSAAAPDTPPSGIGGLGLSLWLRPPLLTSPPASGIDFSRDTLAPPPGPRPGPLSDHSGAPAL